MNSTNRIKYLVEIKGKIKEELLQYKSAYGHIDEIFSRETIIQIKNNDNTCLWYSFVFGIKNSRNDRFKYMYRR